MVLPTLVLDTMLTARTFPADTARSLNPQDLNRQIVKSDRATVTIPELDFEIPPITQKGVFTTIEGLLDRAIENLEGSQPMRRAIDAAGADAVAAFIDRLRAVRNGEALPFTLILDDPSGNSFLENPSAPKPDPALKVRFYARSLEQNHAMGMYAESAGAGVQVDENGNPLVDASGSGTGAGVPMTDEEVDSATMVGSSAQTIFPAKTTVDLSGNVPSKFKKGGALIRNTTQRAELTGRRGGVVRGNDGKMEALVFDSSNTDAAKEVMRFPQACFNCSAPGECRMCVTDVPHFKEVILMAFACDECGWKDVEVKGGGAVPPHGTVTELTYDPSHPDASGDMTRDVIKSDTAAVEIPEIELHMEAGSLGGMYTTVEGLLTALHDKLMEGNPFMSESTDSAERERRAKFLEFTEKLVACRDGALAFTMRLRDPLANSWVYSPTAPNPDPRLTHTTYVRSEEEDLELGLLDMKVENYGEDKDEDAGASTAAASVASS